MKLLSTPPPSDQSGHPFLADFTEEINKDALAPFMGSGVPAIASSQTFPELSTVVLLGGLAVVGMLVRRIFH
jgi:hypothetical protein